MPKKHLIIACAKTNAVISEYTAAPIYMGDEARGSHEWLIEFEKEPTDLDYFTTVLDNALCSINSDYEAKRYKSITLVMPTVRNMPRGTFYNWLSEKGKLGGQNKVPRLCNNRTMWMKSLAWFMKTIRSVPDHLYINPGSITTAC